LVFPNTSAQKLNCVEEIYIHLISVLNCVSLNHTSTNGSLIEPYEESEESESALAFNKILAMP